MARDVLLIIFVALLYSACCTVVKENDGSNRNIRHEHCRGRKRFVKPTKEVRTIRIFGDKDWPRYRGMRPGEWIRLGKNIFRYQGEKEIVWEEKGGLIKINGKVKGINFSRLSIKEGLTMIRKHAKCIESVSWSNAQEIPLSILIALKKHSTGGIAIQLNDFRGSPEQIGRLKVLGEKLESVSYVTFIKKAPGLTGLSKLDKHVEILLSVDKANDGFFKKIEGIKNLVKLRIRLLLPSGLFPNCLKKYVTLRVLGIWHIGPGNRDLDFFKNYNRLWSMRLYGYGGRYVKREALGKLKNLRILSLEKLPGGDVSLSFLQGLNKLQALGLLCDCSNEINAQGMMQLAKLPKLEGLSISFCKVNRQAAKMLPRIKRLKYLSFSNMEKGKGRARALLTYLSRMKKLEGIGLYRVGLQKMGIDMLLPMKDTLKKLSLMDNGLKDHQLKKLRSFKGLEYLMLSENNIGGPSIRYLEGMKKLKMLYLRKTNVGYEGLNYLTRLQKLVYLRLDKTRISDKGYRHLAKMRNLRYLGLQGTQVGDRTLDYLVNMEQLRMVDISNTNVTKEAILEFKNKRPDCEIVHELDM